MMKPMDPDTRFSIDAILKFAERLSLLVALTTGIVLLVHHPAIFPSQGALYLSCLFLTALALVVALLSAMALADDLSTHVKSPRTRAVVTIVVYAVSFAVALQAVSWTAKVIGTDLQHPTAQPSL